MIPKEIFQKIKRIEIRTSRLVNDIFAGQYTSVFKGRGMEFAEVREYQPGDDVRTIDWNVTARFGRPFIKKFVEERELTVILLVDVSGSEYFGSQEKLKSEIAAEIGAVLAFSALRNNDKVGMIVFTDQVEKFVIPKKGRQHTLRIIREILYFQPKSRKTNIAAALKFLNDVCKRKAVVFLISDFRNHGFTHALRVSNQHHDLVGISINDPREEQLPNVGFIQLADNETGETYLVDSRNKDFRQKFIDHNQEQNKQREKMFRSINLDHIEIKTDQSYIEPLIKFFRLRERRMR
ncbi:MAG: DUF58 domain-containing protein [Elusimicrobiota bacterium]